MPANNCRRDCQERFRVEGEDPRRRWPTAKAQGPAFTLSPLARPGKAVALEARIELWSASDHLVAFQFLKTILRDDERFQQSRYAGHNIVSTETGLAATGVFTCRRAVGVEVFLLTSPFIERLRRANPQPESHRAGSTFPESKERHYPAKRFLDEMTSVDENREVFDFAMARL